MEGRLVEWRVTDGGWVQVTRDADRAGSTLLNFAVDDLDAVIARLKAHGVAILKRDDTSDPSGRFAWIVDPDGTKIEFWQPEKE